MRACEMIMELGLNGSSIEFYDNEIRQNLQSILWKECQRIFSYPTVHQVYSAYFFCLLSKFTVNETVTPIKIIGSPTVKTVNHISTSWKPTQIRLVIVSALNMKATERPIQINKWINMILTFFNFQNFQDCCNEVCLLGCRIFLYPFSSVSP